MFVIRSIKFWHNWKSLSLNQFIFLIIILQMHEVLAETDLLGTTTTNGITTINGTMCKKRWTCSSCTEATIPLCSWLDAKKMCVDNTAVKEQGRMVVTNGSSCPKFSVNNRVNASDDHQIITDSVTVNDTKTFPSYQPSGSSPSSNDSSPVHPTLDDGQVFGGVKSGGTNFWVHGQYFSGLRKVKYCVKNRYCCSTYCDVRNDTHMVCPTLRFTSDQKKEYLRFYAQKSNGIEYELELPDLDYHRYHDPEFTDYVLGGCCNVTLHGRHLDKGFNAEDLSIIVVGENSSFPCQITSLDSDQIICKVSQPSSSRLGPLTKQINIMVGDNLKVVRQSKQKYSYYKSPSTQILWPGVVTIGAYVSFIAVLCFALVFFRAKKDYDLLHLHGRQHLAEIRPLDEQNPNDYDDNGKPENMLLVPT
ncbi:uncharacterized protein LOC100167195 isoform X2 [Acyrthosiphon pisum]|nr:uncharacterized protein LOC100167195 isoform X2 [Acyrthosiphon pisum]XP_016659781.1 uncharacterized protein LOC100167195 isoform X2 [Acyrthosiphon pisum]|eukprot:XP_008182989.1 PREDICTED: uncharacterized protein LOC100167195 isoform X2 [Acyrthosiphon pisum]